MKVATAPVESDYKQFRMYRIGKAYQLLITPQVCYLEKLLNDRFDFTQRRIYIEDGKDKAPKYIFIKPELKPKYLYKNSEAKPMYTYTNGETGVIKDDFIVFVPVSLVFDANEMGGLLRQYKLAGTKFTIQPY
jgi:hypothetical protein